MHIISLGACVLAGVQQNFLDVTGNILMLSLWKSMMRVSVIEN